MTLEPTRAPAALLAVALTGSVLLTGAFASWPTVLFVVAMAGVLFLAAYETSWRVVVAVAIIPASLFVAVAFVPETRAATLGLAVWTALVSSAILVRRDVLTRGLTYMLPVYLVHTAVILFQAPNVHRASGLIGNANSAGALLVLGTLTALYHPRTRWLAVPMLFAFPFTGTRWGTAVLLIALGGVAVLRVVPLRVLVPIVAIPTLALVPFYGHLAGAYRIQPSIAANVARIATDTDRRLYAPTGPSIMPQGVVITHGEHNVYSRISAEAGVIAAAAWVGLGALAMYRGRGRERWMIAVIMLLGMLDYYMWVPGKLSLFWWVLLAVNIKREEREHGTSPA